MDENKKAFSGQLIRPRWFYKQWMLAGNPAYFFDTLARECGDFVHYRGLFQFYLINHPSLVKQVLQETHRSFDKQSVIYKRFQSIFGRGLVVAEGDPWRCQRKLLQPLFGPGAVKQYLTSMTASIDRQAWR
ncbi:MAG: cytochrome P450 [Pirellulaceae bacterium]|nr:cytochrome P450 [Pirellulaceae bacterium]